MINIQDIIPFMKKGWVAMDKNKRWFWYSKKPRQSIKLSMWKIEAPTTTNTEALSVTFDIAPADDWTQSLIKVDNSKSEKLKEEFNNNIQRILNND